ncbi:hypothetical protein CF319_g4398 [Tilletia indica]|uniref:FAD dependent oxidoreductase domain-containing protein n=1 Tax=Tilletia indica TaxID=43049 RepID=A0A177TDS2_9BASI|nr:hypothetical protein CF319_g4398 [Tilletia indica]KAE8258729.1 hypothetical protein A4X13_0g1495 [Tilletia indica]
MTPKEHPAIIIVGAGVIGLTTAVVLREQGHTVCLLGRELPSDSTSQHFASVWAGANWCSYAGPADIREQGWETKAWEHFLKIRESRPDLVALIPFLQFLPTEVKKQNLWFSSLCPDFRILGRIPDGFGQETFALSYDSITIHVPHYLQYLLERATGPSSNSSFGPPVEIHRIPSLPSLASVLSFLPASYVSSLPTDAVPILVNATGLGAHDLEDVKDAAVMPARGQTVLVRAPDVKRCVIHAGKESKLSPKLPGDGDGKKTIDSLDARLAEVDIRAAHEGTPQAADGNQLADDPDANQPTYVIPRALSGDIILGGTYQENRWVYEAEEKATLRIVSHCHKICPEIVHPYGQHAYRLHRSIQSKTTNDENVCPATGEPSFVWTPTQPDRLLSATEALEQLDDDEEAVEILRVNVGMRPARKDGVRLERSTLQIPKEAPSPFVKSVPGHKREMPIVHAYGLGPAGYQQSWGVAHAVADLVVEAATQ